MANPNLIQNATILAPLEAGLWSALIAIILIGVWFCRRPEATDAGRFGPLLTRISELRRHGEAKHVQRRAAVRGKAGASLRRAETCEPKRSFPGANL